MPAEWYELGDDYDPNPPGYYDARDAADFDPWLADAAADCYEPDVAASDGHAEDRETEQPGQASSNAGSRTSPPPGTNPATLAIYTLADLRAMRVPAPEPIVEGLLNEGETILIVGRPKVGKSRLVQQLTLDLARGQSFLGCRIPTARRVLLIDLENRPAGVKARFAAMSSHDPSDDQICIYAPETLADGGVNATSQGITNLYGLISQAKPDVLIIDTWRLFAGGDENDAQMVVQALTALSIIRKRLPSLGIILVHHLRKTTDKALARLREDPYSWVECVSGHHALVSHVDACYGLEREIDPTGDDRIVFGGVARNTATSSLLLEEDDQTLRFSVRSGEDVALTVMTNKEREIWDHAKRLGRFNHGELVKAANTTNKKAVSAALRKAQDHGVLRKEGNEYVVQ
jgi:hypothetical protein